LTCTNSIRGVSEGRALEEMSEGIEQRPVGTPVHSERGAGRAGPVRGLEVGVHVCATARVDRLLRVGDKDEGRAVNGTAEQPREDLPLHRVGVLELVDERDPDLRRKLVTAVEPSLSASRSRAQSRTRAVCKARVRSAMHLVDGAVDKTPQASSDRCGPGIVGAWDDMDAGFRAP